MFRELIVILLLLTSVKAEASPALVVDVVDGDTVKVADASGLTVIRLYGIDAPEKKQTQGQEARQFVANMVEGKIVDVIATGDGGYGRTSAIVKLGDQCVQEQMLVSGFAWVYPQYCKKKFCPAWQTLQKIAAENKWGLWNDPMPMQPWVWRKQKR